MLRRLLLCAILAATGLVAHTFAQNPANPAGSREQWRRLYVGGTNIGYVRDFVETVNRGGQRVVVNEHSTVMAIALPRQRGGVVAPSETRSKITVQTEETEDGELLGFRYQVQNPPILSTRKVGRVANGRLHIDTETSDRLTTSDEAFPAGVKGPAYADRLLLGNPLKPGESRTVTTFDPRTAKTDTIQFEARDIENVVLLDGKEMRLLHVVATHSVAPAHVFHEYLDDAGVSWKTTVPSQNMIIYTVSKQDALKTFSDVELP